MLTKLPKPQRTVDEHANQRSVLVIHAASPQETPLLMGASLQVYARPLIEYTSPSYAAHIANKERYGPTNLREAHEFRDVMTMYEERLVKLYGPQNLEHLLNCHGTRHAAMVIVCPIITLHMATFVSTSLISSYSTPRNGFVTI